MSFVDVSNAEDLLQLCLKETTAAMVSYFKARRMVEGDRFATNHELEMLLGDPWAWSDLARPMFEAMFLWGDVLDFSLYPDHRPGVLHVRLHRRG